QRRSETVKAGGVGIEFRKQAHLQDIRWSERSGKILKLKIPERSHQTVICRADRPFWISICGWSNLVGEIAVGQSERRVRVTDFAVSWRGRLNRKTIRHLSEPGLNDGWSEIAMRL